MAVTPKEAAGLATLTNDPATRAQVPKASLRRSPHDTSATTVGVGGLWSSVGDGGVEATEHRSITPAFTITSKLGQSGKGIVLADNLPDTVWAHSPDLLTDSELDQDAPEDPDRKDRHKQFP